MIALLFYFLVLSAPKSLVFVVFLFYRVHKAVLVEQLNAYVEDAENIANEVYHKISISEALYKLAATPLLCAMICALHYKSERILPTNKRELYEECCKMLLDKRDAEKGININDIPLSYEQKKVILSKLAYWMMKNNHVETGIEDSIRVVERAIQGMGVSRDKASGNIIFKYLLERSGILREPEKGRVDFLHRTFQEYLTACEINREEDWGLLKDKIGNDTWQETIGICIGFAKESRATKLIRATLKKGNELGEEEKYLFLAINFMNSAVEVDKSLRKELEQSVSILIPPKSMDYDNLANAGEVVIPYLENQTWYTSEERLACLNVLKRIDSVRSLEVTKSYLKQPLSAIEIDILGELYSEFRKKDLIESGIAYAILEYINYFDSDQIVILHAEMLFLLMTLETKEVQKLISKKIKKIAISSYDDYYDALLFCNADYEYYYIDPKEEWPCDINCRNLYKVVEAAETIIISGYFSKGNILSKFKSVKNLYIYNQSGKFNIYTVEKCLKCHNKLERFGFVDSAEEYINGKDLDFLSGCKQIDLVLLDNGSEVSFEEFSEFYNLEILVLGADFAEEFLYIDLPESIKKIIILLPEIDKERASFLKDGKHNVEFYTIREYVESVLNGQIGES